MYAIGFGLPKDKAEAAAWFRKVADHGVRWNYEESLVYESDSGKRR